MTTKFLKMNGEVVPQSNLRSHTVEERENLAHIELRRKFTEICKTMIGPKATLGDFMPDELTPEWEKRGLLMHPLKISNQHPRQTIIMSTLISCYPVEAKYQGDKLLDINATLTATLPEKRQTVQY